MAISKQREFYNKHIELVTRVWELMEGYWVLSHAMDKRPKLPLVLVSCHMPDRASLPCWLEDRGVLVVSPSAARAQVFTEEIQELQLDRHDLSRMESDKRAAAELAIRMKVTYRYAERHSERPTAKPLDEIDHATLLAVAAELVRLIQEIEVPDHFLEG